jgi:3-oxoacyl-[acyl-carrier-protein] synthase II
MLKKSVLVTGLGLVTPAGCNVPDFLRSIYNGGSGVKTIRHVDASKYRTQLAATDDNSDPQSLISEKDRGRRDRGTQMALVAAEMALKDAGLLSAGAVSDSDAMGRCHGHRHQEAFMRSSREDL